MRKTMFFIAVLFLPVLLTSRASNGPGRASLALAGYEVVSAETAVSTTSPKQLQVSCPNGKKAVGAGWGVLDSTGAILQGRATYFEPSFDGTAWLVNAVNDSGFSPNWKLSVRVICAE